MTTMRDTIESIFASGALSAEFFGNNVSRYLLVLILFFVFSFIARIIFQHGLSRFKTESNPTKLDVVLIVVLHNIRPSFYMFIAFYLSVKFLDLSISVGRVINVALLAFLTYQVAVIAGIVIGFFIKRRVRHKDEEGQAQNAAHLLTLLAQIGIWMLGLLLILSNFGIDVTSLIAGLGIGGIAIAFALQNILGDLFSSFALHFDKPFVVGDFIIVGDKMGVVQKIGIKTTRIKALQGEELVIANQDLTTAKIQNFKRMQERRVPFTISVTYNTSIDKIKRIPEIAKKILVEEKLARFDRAHFKEFGASSLDFEFVYYLLSADYNAYMDTQQSINLKIMEAFEKEGIEFAYPTQTLFVHNADSHSP